jgi:hypothetical protein
MRDFIFAVSALTLGIIPNTGFAADIIPIEENSVTVTERMAPDWTWSVDPFYSWLPGMKGDLRVLGGAGVSVNVTTGDILENLDVFLSAIDGIYMGSGEYRNSQFGLQWDIVYLDLGGSVAFGNQISGASDFGFKLSMSTLAANYRVLETPTYYVDIIGGLRVTDVQVDLAVTLGPLGVSRSGGDTWVDPVIGLKGRYDLTDNWYLKGSALFGGFGVSSDSLYDLTGLVGYEWNNGIELYGGWRIADTDYENGSFKWNIQLSGPMAGLAFKF